MRSIKTLYEIYIVKEDDFANYKLISPIELIDSINLLVSLNDEDVHYTLSEGVLYFANPLSVGDKIIIKASILDNVKLFTKNSYSRSSLLKVFNGYMKLKSNNKYTFTLNAEDKTFSNNFSTKYDPFYCSVKTIRTDTGDLLNNVTDEQIAKVIHNNSKETLEKLELLDEMPEKTPSYAKNYTRYKTDIDFCYSVYLSMSGKIGTVSKTIGDIKIDTTYKIPYLDDMLSRFKELLTPNQELLNNGATTSTSVSFVKAQNTEYPVSTRGVF